MGVCSDTDEVMENLGEEDPFEKRKREKLLKGNPNSNSGNIMTTVASLCMGDNGMSFDEIKKMNLIEVKEFIKEQSNIYKNNKNRPKESSENVRDIEDINIKKL